MPPELHRDIRFRAVGDEGVVLDQRRAEILVVNEQGLRILQLLGEKRERAEIVMVMAREYLADEAAIAADVDAFLTDLDQRGLLA